MVSFSGTTRVLFGLSLVACSAGVMSERNTERQINRFDAAILDCNWMIDRQRVGAEAPPLPSPSPLAHFLHLTPTPSANTSSPQSSRVNPRWRPNTKMCTHGVRPKYACTAGYFPCGNDIIVIIVANFELSRVVSRHNSAQSETATNSRLFNFFSVYSTKLHYIFRAFLLHDKTHAVIN